MKRGSVPVRTALVVVACALALAAGFFVRRSGHTSTPAIRNILLISMDTTRADHLSCYDYGLPTTPNIDAFAKEATLFDKVISPVPLTTPAHCTMLTGTLPPYHQVHDNLLHVLGPAHVTLAEVLGHHGLSTCAIVSAVVLNRVFGLHQGFDTYDDTFEAPITTTNIAERRGDETTRNAMDWLDAHAEERFFMFVHYYDPHHFYSPPEPFATQFKENPYAGEIAFVDHCVGQLLDKLKAIDLYDSTLVVITADHGEMRGEHGEPSHAYFIYQGAVSVPLIVRLPGQTTSKRVEPIAGIVDIVPTICSLLDIELPTPIHGRDLSPYLVGETDADQGDRYVYCESLTPTKYAANSLLGIVGERWKYIQTTRPELYDLATDPREAQNLYQQNPEAALMLEDRLKRIVDASISEHEGDSRIDLSEQAVSVLQSLGYVGGDVDDDFTFDQAKDDPKDLIDFHNEVGRLQRLAFQRKHDEANTLGARLVAQRPEVSQVRIILGQVALKGQAYDTAVGQFEAVLEKGPDHVSALRHLAEALEGRRQVDEAIIRLEQLARIRSDSSQVHYDLGRLYHQRGEVSKALDHGNTAAKLSPESAQIQRSLAATYLQAGRVDAALTHMYRIAELEPDNIANLNALAWGLATAADSEARNPADAVRFAGRACELTKAEAAEALDTLAAAYAAAGKFPEAIDTAERAIEAAKRTEKPGLAGRTTARLRLYRAHKPYTETMGPQPPGR